MRSNPVRRNPVRSNPVRREAVGESTAALERDSRSPRYAPKASAVITLMVAALMAVGTTLAVSYGSTPIPPTEVWSTVLHGLGGANFATGTTELIVWQVRVPRPILALLVGAGLGLVGVAVQTLVRNPLADPYVLGISSGASLGAVWVLVLGASASVVAAVGITLVVPLAAFAGAAVAFALVWGVTRLASRGAVDGFSPLRLVLAGVAVGHMFAAVTSFLVLQTDDQGQTRSVLYWLMGSLGGATWTQLPVTAAVVAAGALWLFARARALNALSAGDETAAALGVSVRRIRREIFVIASVVTGALVAVSGAIGFVGLIVPHLSRLVVGSDHRKLLPMAVLVGATLMVWVDLGCRVATRAVSQELPVNVVTALLGGPVLLLLLARRPEHGGGE